MSTSYLVFLVVVPLACCSGPSDFTFPCASDLKSHKNWRLLDTSDICGESGSSVETRIIGGKQAKEGEFPWMTMIVESEYGINNSICGGSIINDRYILTAAHCLDPKVRFVRVGELNSHNLSDCYGENCRAKNIAIEEYILHEAYDKDSSYNDIGLIRLKERIQFDDTKRPICLPTSCNLANKNFKDTKLLLAGWGLNDQNIDDGPLRKVEVVATGLDECRERWKPDEIRDSEICTWGWRPGGIRGMNVGDSGSPLLYRDDRDRHIAIGVASFHFKDENHTGNQRDLYKRYPHVYSRVSYYMPWILEKVRA